MTSITMRGKIKVLAVSFFLLAGVGSTTNVHAQANTNDRTISNLAGVISDDDMVSGACLCVGRINNCDKEGNCVTKPLDSCGGVPDQDSCHPDTLSNNGATCEGSKSFWCTLSGPMAYVHIDSCIYQGFEPAAPLKNANIQSRCTDLAKAAVQNGITADEEQAVRKIQIRKPIINIFIPDLTFSDVRTSTIDSEGTIQIPWIGEYIAAVYRLAVSVASILAVVLLIREGALIILSGGGEEKIQGYRNIARILTGLVLAWSSYVILYNVNASLVSFKPLQIRFIDAETFNQDDHNCDDPAQCDQPDPNDPTKPIPQPIPLGLGKCASDLKLAQKDRKVRVNYSLFGQVDGRSYGKRTLQEVSMIVVHNGGYTAEGNNETWQKRKAAAHYTIDRNGMIYQHVGEECIVPHAPGGNKAGIGIELNITNSGGKSCNNMTSDPAQADAVKEACSPTSAQYASLRALIDDIVSRTNAIKDTSHIVGHCELVGKSGHGDPRAFDWTQIGLDNDQKKLQAQGHACSWYLPFTSAASSPSSP